MKNARDVAAYIMEAISLATQHGGAEGEQSITITSFREDGVMANAEGFTITFGRGFGAHEYQVTIVRSRRPF